MKKFIILALATQVNVLFWPARVLVIRIRLADGSSIETVNLEYKLGQYCNMLHEWHRTVYRLIVYALNYYDWLIKYAGHGNWIKWCSTIAWVICACMTYICTITHDRFVHHQASFWSYVTLWFGHLIWNWLFNGSPGYMPKSSCMPASVQNPCNWISIPMKIYASCQITA